MNTQGESDLKQFVYRNVLDDFIIDPTLLEHIDDAIKRIESETKNRQTIDETYDTICISSRDLHACLITNLLSRYKIVRQYFIITHFYFNIKGNLPPLTHIALVADVVLT